MKLQPVSGGSQTILVGQAFQPITVRITNSATPANPVTGVAVTFQSLTFLPDSDVPVETGGDGGTGQFPMNVLLASSQSAAVTDMNGLASFQPSTGSLMRPLEIEVMASTSGGGLLQYELPVLAAPTPPAGQSTGRARVPVRMRPGAQPVPRAPVRFVQLSGDSKCQSAAHSTTGSTRCEGNAAEP